MAQLDAIMATIILHEEKLSNAQTIEEYQEIHKELKRWLEIYKEQANKKH